MQLSAEQVNQFLADAVLKSTIGDAVKAAVEKSIKDLSATYQNPFEQVIKNHVVQLIDKEVTERYRPRLEGEIRSAMAKVVTEETMAAIIKAATERLGRVY
jgi:hypothetical protein